MPRKNLPAKSLPRCNLSTSSAAGMKCLLTNSRTRASVQANCLSLTPLNHVMPQGWPFMIHSRIGLFSFRASIMASPRLGRHGISRQPDSSFGLVRACRIVAQFFSFSSRVRAACGAAANPQAAGRKKANKAVSAGFICAPRRKDRRPCFCGIQERRGGRFESCLCHRNCRSRYGPSQRSCRWLA